MLTDQVQMMETKTKKSVTSAALVASTTEKVSESLRYKVLIANFPRIVEAVSQDVVKFAVDARSKLSFITDRIKNQAVNPYRHEYDRASALMAEILSKIKDNDAYFDDLIALLQELNFIKLASDLKRAVEVESTTRQDTLNAGTKIDSKTKAEPSAAALIATVEEIPISKSQLQYEVFVKNFPRLVEAVSCDVVKFAVIAHSKSLITDRNKTQAENPNAREYNRASILTSQILLKIKNGDAHFDDFFAILQELGFTKLAYELETAVNVDSTTKQDLLDVASKKKAGLSAIEAPIVKDSSEADRYSVLVQNLPHLLEAVGPVVVKFAVNARSRLLISNYTKTLVDNPYIAEYDRADMLISPILHKIKVNDAYFDDFIAILQELNFSKLASDLKGAVDSTESKNRQYLHEKFLDSVSKAMQEKGTLEHTLIHGLFSGPAGSGKSSLMSRLLGEMPDVKLASTGVANSVVKVKVKKLTSTAVSVKSSSSWKKLLYSEEAIGTINFTAHATRFEISCDSTSTLPSNEGLSKSTPAVPPTHNQFKSALPESLPLPALPKGYVAPRSLFRNALDSKQFKELQHHFKSSWSLYLTDTGGQIEFQEVLPLLVSGASIFFLTFRLDQDIGERYMIEYRLPGGIRSEPYESTLTVKEMIFETLASVASMKVATDSIPQLMKNEQINPKVFVVGTHKDRLDEATRESKINEIDRSLQDIIKPTSHYGDFLEFASESRLIFAVNNFSKDDLDFENIRSSVENIVERDEYKMTFPSHWLIFGLVIRQETIEDKIITYDECLAIAKDCGISDRTELDNALKFLYKTIGLVCHFDSSTLKDIVIRDPQVVFDHLTELIVQTFSFGKVGKQRSERFKQDGIFCSEELHRSMRSYKHMTAEKLVQLFEHLLIIAPFKDSHGKTKYFLPCILAHSTKHEPQSLSNSMANCVPPLVLTFKCGYCPKGLTRALIVYLLTHEPRSKFKWRLRTEQIFRDQVSFLVSPYDIITLHIHPTHLMLSHSRELSTALEPIENICSCTREFVEEGISNVISTMKLTSDAHHSLSFHCQGVKCIKQNGIHPASEIMRNTNADLCSLCCDRSGRKIISHLPDRYHTWFGHVKKHLTKPQADDDDVDICKTKSLDSDQPLYTNSDKKSVIKLYKPKATKLDPKPLRENVKLILLTTTEDEKWAVYEKLKPPNFDCSQLDKALYFPKDHTVIGTFADYTVAVLTTEQGKKCERELKRALDSFPNVQSIISVGVGYGKSRETINIGDVMVSDHIEDASQVSIVEPSRKKLKLEQCGGRLPIKRSLLRYFKNKSFEWETENEFHVAKDGRISQAKVGTIVSCDTLMKSMTLRDQYMELMAHTVGGEMQGASLIGMREWMDDERRPLSVIVVKGVADFGDNQVYDENWEYTAAKAAVDFVHYCLKETNGQGEFL